MRYTIVALLLMLVAGCSTDVEQYEDNGYAIMRVESEGFVTYITEIELSDGTRCAVSQGMRKGGISCAWEASRGY